MRLDRYLARIGFDGNPAPTRDTLNRLLRAHALSVPFENLDVQLGQPTTTDVGAAYRKIVERGRGGWCYEQNGLFGWALSEIGFDATRVAAAVMRHERGTSADASHLCLLVRMPEAGAGSGSITDESAAQGKCHRPRRPPPTPGLARAPGGIRGGPLPRSRQQYEDGTGNPPWPCAGKSPSCWRSSRPSTTSTG